MMLGVHNLTPFRLEKTSPKTTSQCQQNLPDYSEKQKGAEGVFNPKFILNFRYRTLEKNLKANQKD